MERATARFSSTTGHELDESIVERGDGLPVRFRRSTRASVTGGDGGLKGVGAEGATESIADFLGTLERGEAATRTWSQRVRS